MSGYREPRRVTAHGATLCADGDTYAVSIRDVSSHGIKIEGLPRDLDAFKVSIKVADARFEGIIVWKSGGTAGIRLSHKMCAHTVAFIRHATRIPLGRKPRFLMP